MKRFAEDGFTEDGFTVIPEGLLPKEHAELCREFPPEAPNRRNLFTFSPLVERLAAHGSFVRYAEEILGTGCFAVRAIFFNKILKSNWHVPWHQDIGVPVKERREVEGFSAFTRKDGVLHANAPSSVLENLLILRLHLDDATADNGAMRLVKGSHRAGRLREDEVDAAAAHGEQVQPEIPARGILRLSPLLLHASAHASADRPRRVIHIEYASQPLPDGLEWAWQVRGVSRLSIEGQ
ncbi:MAG: phytanoyl-CoA dioxygenase family protein [Bryobacter sp.]|nr:phytanoyl-CoA dioxygenase family protein [Bryobacter sp.]